MWEADEKADALSWCSCTGGTPARATAPLRSGLSCLFSMVGKPDRKETLPTMEANQAVVPSTRHFAVGKETGLTNYIERFNNTLRQRISRLVRKTLSFSKKLENQIGAIWNFIHEYNQQIRKKMEIV
jgi:IS1 transposase